MSFIPSGILNDIKKLANIEKDGEVIAYATNNNLKKKKDHNHDRKKKNSKKDLIKNDSNENQLPSLNENINIKKDNELKNMNNNVNLSSTSINKKNIMKNSHTRNNNNLLSTNKEIIYSNDEQKNINNNLNKSSSSINKNNTTKINTNDESKVEFNKSNFGKIKLMQTASPVEAPAFQYPLTKSRVGHLQNKVNKNTKLKKELAFLYNISNSTDNNINNPVECLNNEINKENHINTIVNEIIPKINVIPNNNIKNVLFDESRKITGAMDNQNYSKDEINLLTKSVIPKDLNPKELNFVSLKNSDDDEVFIK